MSILAPAAVEAVETCAEVVDDGAQVCGAEVTDVVTWALWPDGVCRPQTPVTRRVCGDCATWLMTVGATHLRPSRAGAR